MLDHSRDKNERKHASYNVPCIVAAPKNTLYVSIVLAEATQTDDSADEADVVDKVDGDDVVD